MASLGNKFKKQKLPHSEDVVSISSDSDLGESSPNLSSLDPGRWLNDEIVNAFGEIQSETHPRSHVVSTHFVTILKSRGFEGVAKWNRDVDLFSKRALLFPIHVAGDHWALAVADLLRNEFTTYDSRPTSNHALVVELLIGYIRTEHVRRYPNRPPAFACTRHISTNAPKQHNSFDCGAFVCVFIEKLCEFYERDDPACADRTSTFEGNYDSKHIRDHIRDTVVYHA